MKKILTSLLALVLVLSLALSMASCTEVHPIQKFLLKMQSAKSYNISVSMTDVPFLGTVSISSKVDGNVQYIPETIVSEEAYIEYVSDAQYIYTKNAKGEWTKTKSELDLGISDLCSNEQILAFFDAENFEAVEGKENVYRQKDDADFGEYTDLTITVKDDSCTVSCTAAVEGLNIGVVIVISELGKVDLTLPEVK